MKNLLNWEQNRIIAMLLVGIMLFNAVMGIEMQNVYAEEYIAEEMEGTVSTDVEGTTDGSEDDGAADITAGDITDGDVVSEGDIVTGGDVSGGLVSEGDVSADLNLVVAAAESMPITPTFDEDDMVTYYRGVNGSYNIRVSGSVKCMYEVEEVRWSASSFKTGGNTYNMNQGTKVTINRSGSEYSFSFDGNISGTKIYICAQSKTSYTTNNAYEQIEIDLNDDDEEDNGDGLIEDTSAPNIKILSISENFQNKNSGNYFRGTITLKAENVVENKSGIKGYVIQKKVTLDDGTEKDVTWEDSSYDAENKTIDIWGLTELSSLYIVAEDRLGNLSDAKSLKSVVKKEEYDDEEEKDVWVTFFKTNDFMIDPNPPVITFEANDGTPIKPGDNENYEWHSDWTSVTYKVIEKGTQFEYVKVKPVNSSDLVEVSCENNEVENTIDLIDGVNKIIVEAKDYAGHITTSQMIVGIDRQAPTITSCSLAPIDPKNSLNMLPFGNFANGDVNVSVTAIDENNGEVSAGIKEIKLYIDNSLKETIETDGTEQKPITIQRSWFSDKAKKNITVSAVDNSGLESTPIPINQITSTTILSDKMLIETEKPIARLDMENAFGQTDSRKVVGKTFEITAGGEDAHSGIYSYQIVYKDEQNSVSENVLITEEKKSVSENVVVSVDELGDVTGNTIKIEVTAYDNAGNVSDVKAQEFFIDKKAPVAKKFVIIAGEETEEAEIVSSGDYGYFFNEEVDVRLYFDDGVVGETSGVKTITCYTIDSEGKRVDREVSAVNSESAGNTSSKTADKDVSKGDASDGNAPDEAEDSAHNYYYATIEIEDGFKGHIYASATDHADNAMDSYASTKGVVVETMSRHETEQHVAIDLPKSPAKDDEGNNLYAENVTIPVTIIDTMSGINSIWWEVDAPHDKNQNYTGSISIGDIIEDVSANGKDSEWTIEHSEKNLVYKVKKDFVVSNNSNGINISIYMMDNAGNVIKEDKDGQATISIDKTKPTIEISFDNNDPDEVYTDIYSEDRTATITVKERNFSGDKISVDIANAIGGTPSVSGWSTYKDTENPDESTHKATVTFSEDGEYTMVVNGEDAVGNDADSKSIDPFILDKTLPKLEVSYSNNNVRNGNYYADARTVIVTVTERNFAPERVRLTGTVTGSGTTRSFPVLSSFTQRGDVYTATALCQDDGLYSFSVEYSDKAGNQGQTHTAAAYHIDKTAPVISFAGVEPNSANNGDLMPQVIMTDNNFNKNGVNIQLIGANNGLVELGGTFSNLTNGQGFTYYNFPKEVEYDDLYTINVEVSDLAGNVVNGDITFSVNRFGSVYVFDQSLKEIAGTYVQSPVDVNLTEVNIDSLEHETIKVVMDYNGTSRDLVEGDDYEVQQVRGEGSWYRYNYNIDSSLFEGDGRYIVALYSVDRAGNINQNTDEAKKAEISFGVDKTAPVVIPIDLEKNKQYAVDMKTATIAVNDNLLLKNVAIYIDGIACEYTNNGENYVINIPSSKTKQQITILATDMAGNVTEHIVGGVLVNTNLFIRWYNNRPLFVGTLLMMAAMCCGGVIFLAVYRRRKYED